MVAVHYEKFDPDKEGQRSTDQLGNCQHLHNRYKMD
jgi:hypothetical protein